MAKKNESQSVPEKSTETEKERGDKALRKLQKKGLARKPAAPPSDQANASDSGTVYVDDQSPDKFRAAVLFVIMILFLLLVFVEGSSGWQRLHEIIRGFFGITVLLIPILLGMAAWKADSEENDSIQATAKWNIIITVIVAGAIQVLFNGSAGENNIVEYIKYLYQDGVENTFGSGGVVSVILAYPLLTLLGTTGARIVMILLLITLMFWVSRKSPRDLLMMLTRPFVSQEAPDDAEDEETDEQPDVPMDYIHGDDEPEKEKKPLRKRMRSFFLGLEDEDETEYSGQISNQPAAYAYPEEYPENTPYPQENGYPAPPQSYMPEGTVPFYDEEPQPVQEDGLDEIIHQPGSTEPEHNIDIDVTARTPYGIPAEGETPAPDPKKQEAPQKPVVFYQIPPISFLKNGTSRVNDARSREELSEKAAILLNTLKSFGVEVRITGIYPGPAVTRYEVQPAAGVKVSKITGLADDIALNLAASGVRIEAPIPGKPAIGIEVPNSTKDTVALRDILESEAFRSSKSKLTFAVGKDIAGTAIVGDVAKMPHMIIAGATGSGKSVCTNSIIMSILMNAAPDEVKMILIDPKIVEFRVYEGIPHLLIPVVTDPKKAAGALNWAVQEMLRRYKQFAEQNVRDIYDYNEKASFPGSELERMPQIVIAIDELADLMMAASKEVEDAICRLAQMARAAGMHLIIATQRPTTDIITGLIKANIPSRIALSVMSQIDSRTILDMGGAEKLLGHGDMLYLPNGMPKPIRVQGCFTSTAEIEQVVNFIKEQAQTTYDHSIMEEVEQNIPVTKADKAAAHQSEAGSDSDGDAALIEQAIEVVVQMGQASTSSLQRKLKLGYARAARIMDELEKLGVIGPYEGAKPRRVLLTPQQLAERKARNMK